MLSESRGSSFRLLPALILVAGCGGGDSPGVMRPPPGPPPPPDPVPTTVSVTPPTASFTALGRTVQLTAEVRDQGGQVLTGVTVSWSSSATPVATVDANGLVTAVRGGIATITAAAGNATGIARVTVEQSAASVTVAPPSLPFDALGDTARATATVSDEDEHPIPGAAVSWASDYPDVATVDSAGLVTATGQGAATITATVGTASGEAQVEVKQLPLSIEVTSRGSALAIGDSMQFAATVLDRNGHPVGGLTFAWSSSDPAVATVDDRGWVRGVAEGSADIAAETGELSDSKKLAVQGEADLMRGALIALYESTDGPNWKRNDNWLSDAPLADWFGVSTDAEGRVTQLSLVDNGLRGSIPPRIGNLRALRSLWLYSNELSGSIPPELGNLLELQRLGLSSNDIDGSIPPELGRLTKLITLWLQYNDLSGPIPSELGNLASLETAWLYNNRLSGQILPEIGKLRKLTDLQFHANELSGPIPPELGDLTDLAKLYLYQNRLGGPIPPELGNLSNLTELLLHENRLRGQIPAELGRLTKLTRLQLNDNTGLSGLLPLELAGLGSLTDLLLEGTGLCAPNDPDFRGWLAGLAVAEVALCRQGGAPFYLIQAVQSLENPVPLVAGEDALLRVFPFAVQSTDERIPPVRATFYDQGSLVHEMEIPAGSAVLPTEFADGPLEESANGLVPGSVLQPGVEMVIEVDPDTTVTLSLGVHERIPETGRLALEVHDMRPLNLTVVPYLWRSDPDTAFARRAGELTAEHETLSETRTLLPVGDLDVRTHEPVWTDVDPIFEHSLALLREVEALRMMEGSSRHYMGMLRDGGGQGFIPGRATVSELVGETMAHELGHNMSLLHAPCAVTEDVDPGYPHERGAIGARGYDVRDGSLVAPAIADLMAYCRPRWISDYHFTKAAEHRLRANASVVPGSGETTRTLLLWGGVENGRMVLDPSFLVNAAPRLPAEGGPYRLEGRAASGEMVFSLHFDMPAASDGEPGDKGFVFALPVAAGWEGLASISLSGPEGTVSLDRHGANAMGLLIDDTTGAVRGFLRDVAAADGAAVLPEPGLRMRVSRGVPGLEAWRR
ncbi:Ig-like domain-containing protein [Candidatus Palauibacter sp.]|uniref:Ig-like domain-containing protein n=1 Tax=Candidatus Palauibacter sp. TaxID=3101350 RepID=UPI003B59F112